ncbi:MAG TPA: hypothetical protein VGZ89_17465 [Xanthobacteraceae bacterium]|nr:hypothetical protein [Xanthobacteraceae bacterium]
MKSTTLTVAAAAMVIFAQSAEAREHHRGHRHHHSLVASRGTFVGERSTRNGLFAFAAMNIQSSATVYRGRDRARPAAWCGWEMRHLVGADPGPSFNLARNWTRWGRPGPAGIGAVVVWPHHVGKIVGQQNGEWIIESGNDGHALRARPRSIAGAIAIRWG